jgi:ornithine carbamoyltransferase
LSLRDFSNAEIRYLLYLSHDLKKKKRLGLSEKLLAGKSVVLLFEKTSTRTRCAFEVAAYDEGAQVTFLDKDSSQMSKKESLEDTAKVLGRFYDAVEYRGYDQAIVETLASHSGVPVFNGLTDTEHPTQILADLMTMEEHLAKPLNKCSVCFVGDVGNNMSLTWMHAARMGFTYIALGPEELYPRQEIIAEARAQAERFGGQIEFTNNPDAIRGADVIYTDVWVSMGDEDEMEELTKLLTPYRVTEELFKKIGADDAIFMHCLPSFHDFETLTARQALEKGLDIREVTDEVFRAPYSIVFDEAENRLHTIKAIMVATMG